MLKVAIVDDEEIVRMGLAVIISEAGRGYKVIASYANGEEALEKLLNTDVDVVVTDIRMPEMDGLELIRNLLALHANISIIILSGYNDFEYARSALRLGAEEYLLKPVDQNELFQCLDRIRVRKYGAASNMELENNHDKRIVERLKAMIDKEYSNKLSLAELSGRFFLHPKYLSRYFKSETGINITDYLIHVRMNKAKDLLLNNLDLKVYEVAEKVGYADSVFFTKLFKRMVGVAPKEYRDQAGI